MRVVAGLCFLLAAQCHGQLISGKVGLKITCPSGPQSCWPQVRESITFSGFKSDPDLDTSTMTIHFTPKTPDARLSTMIFEVTVLGAFYGVRGFELELDGVIRRTKGVTTLVLPNGDSYRLTKPTHRIEQGLGSEEPRPLEPRDLTSWSELEHTPTGQRVRVTGNWMPPFKDAARTLGLLSLTRRR